MRINRQMRIGIGGSGPRLVAPANPGQVALDSLDFYWEGDDLADETASIAPWADRNAAELAGLRGVTVSGGLLIGDTTGNKTVDMPAAATPALDTTDNFTVLFVATNTPSNGDYQRLWSCRDSTGTSDLGLAVLWRGNINNVQARCGDGTSAANAQHASGNRPTVDRNLVAVRFTGGDNVELVTYNATDGISKTSVDISTFGDCTGLTAHPILFREGSGGSFSFSGSCEAVGQTQGLLADAELIDIGGLLL